MPCWPIILMYIQLMGKILAEPQGAADMVPLAMLVLGTGCTGWPGKKGFKCSATPIGPMPGPPPPWGMQKVLCRFKCDTSPPNLPGAATPTRAFMLAPSIYTWPPILCTAAHDSVMLSSNTPWVEG